jgi:AmiR/NasT family two-component response regulator
MDVVVGPSRNSGRTPERDLLTELAECRRHIENLERALTTNRTIGVAIGILMARRGLTAEQAFDVLRTASQHANRKMSELADEVVYTGILSGGVAS